MMRKVWASGHKWIGLIAGILLTITCATGVLLSFEKEIIPLTIHKIYYAAPNSSEPLKMVSLLTELQKEESGKSVKSITYPADPARNLVVRFADSPDEEVYVDPYTGKVVGSFIYKGSFFSVVRELHRFLLMGTTGRVIVGSATLCFVIILLSGLFLRLPVSLRKLPRLFRFQWQGNVFRKTYMLHAVLGMYAFVFLLIMSLTGPFWSFSWYNKGLSSLFGIGQTTSNRKANKDAVVKVKQLAASDFSLMSDKLSALAEVQSDWKEMRLTFPDIREKSFSISVIPMRQIHGRQSDTYTYDLKTGNLEKESVFKNKPLQETFRMWVFAVHTGSWGGWFVKLLYGIAALIGATLPITGYLLWWKKRTISKRKK
ncbi:MAG: PepSY-associated TM helix domain-containing protein [Bacteroidales bacterium]